MARKQVCLHILSKLCGKQRKEEKIMENGGKNLKQRLQP
jgi:hypothetical protein